MINNVHLVYSHSRTRLLIVRTFAAITSGITDFHEWEYSVQFFETMVTNV
jgi:hypothetical protein